MIALYVLNLVVAIFLLGMPLWLSRRYLRLPLVNPLTIYMAVWMPFDLMSLLIGPIVLIDDSIWDKGFQYAVLMSSVSTISKTAGTVFFFRLAGTLRIEQKLSARANYLSFGHLKRASYAFFVIFLCAFYLLASAELGVMNWLKNPRIGYQLYRTGQGHWYALALSALSVACVLSYLATPKAKNILIKMFLFLAAAYLLGSKGVMLAFFTSTLIFLWFIGWQHVTKLFVICAPAVFVLLAWNLYLGYADNFELQSIIEYFDYYKNAADYYREVLAGNIALFYGQVISSSYWAYVPRALFPDKPFVYGVLHVNEIFYPGQAELTNTPAFGGAVTDYADFGIIGVFLFGFLSSTAIVNGFLYRIAFSAKRTVPFRATFGILMTLIVLFGPQFGTFFPGIMYGLLVGVTAFLIWAFKSGRKRTYAESIKSPKISSLNQYHA